MDVIEIPLTKGYTAIVDFVDADLVNFKWNAHDHKKSRIVYASRGIKTDTGKNKTLSLHAVIFERVYGYMPTRSVMCDHVDGNGLNCTRENLRPATHMQNCQNSRGKLNNSTGLKGVYPNGNQFHAIIQSSGERQFLGCFDTPLEAHKIYCIAALKFHRQYANFGTNSPFTKAEIFGLELPPPPVRDNRHQHRTVINKSGLKGVYPNTKGDTWQAIITVNKKRTYVGNFSDALDAHRAVCEVLVREMGNKAHFGPTSPFTLADFMEQDQQQAA